MDLDRETIYPQMLDFCKKAFDKSPYAQSVSVNQNKDGSVSFLCGGQKPFGCALKKTGLTVVVKNELLQRVGERLPLDEVEITTPKSMTDFTRLSAPPTQEAFAAILGVLFDSAVAFADELYEPEYVFDCCHLYTECSDAKRCVDPDYLHAKGCTYRKKLEAGIIFYGKNRNTESQTAQEVSLRKEQKGLDFVAIDFETANASRTSACSLGITTVKNNEIIGWTNFYFKPYPLVFDPVQSAINGISEQDVADAPTFDRLWRQIIEPMIDNKTVVAHNASFDVSVLRQTLEHYGLPMPSIDILCTYKITQVLFPAAPCHRLDFMAAALGIPLDHHNAASDSRACAELLLRLIRQHNVEDYDQLQDDFGVRMGRLDLFDYHPCRTKTACARCESAAHYNEAKAKTFEGLQGEYVDDDFVDKHFVFTGTLLSMPRARAMEIVARGGGHPQDNITRKTDYLVVGIQDLGIVKDGQSGKMRKAAELRAAGSNIEVIGEDQFVAMIDDELLSVTQK